MSFKAFTIEDIRAKVEKGYEVEITGFNFDEDPNDVFPCVLRKVDLLAWAQHGKIPNILEQQVRDLFDATEAKKKAKEGDDKFYTFDGIAEWTKLLEWMAEVSMVEPKYSDLVENGIYLSQHQLNDIYVFQMQGVEALKSFRDFNRDAANGDNVRKVLAETLGSLGDRG